VHSLSNRNGRGGWYNPEGPNNIILEQAIHFTFDRSNNHAKYETTIARPGLPQEWVWNSWNAKATVSWSLAK